MNADKRRLKTNSLSALICVHRRPICLFQQRTRKAATPDEIADKADRGEDISSYFTNKFTVVGPVRRVNIDLTVGMLRELDARAAQLNISRQGRPRRKKAG
jgi:hypothetical protein